ncbi:Aste57867_5120 [Aphanomyces stellatus]|uniref:Aste57867_5120 protein n=1 Tax=Aphanomyces stellatus TaxID=120398 RepID=A0A485KCH1_9STRA|nr:hypothetical protein As57867_005107 [Aphanomyces stellatus]VFT82200.1 Aste57867_5120 [Aphanomyces stellatus]
MKPNFATFFSDLALIRRHIHENPELSFQEFKTQALVKQYLIDQVGIPSGNIRECATTGLVVDIFGPSDGPSTSPLTCIAFRGDMDALPMTESNPQLPHASNVPGAAHMCGHDGHTASLMGFGSLVFQRRHLLPAHTFVRLLFQPAEEGHFGAPAMIKEGCLDSVDEVYGYHNFPFPLGTIGVKSGPMMAHAAFFTIHINGPGGHGSAPHFTKDPIVAAAQVITAMQTIVSRNLSAHDAAVVSITQVHGGEADNVIPSNVRLSGTLRDFSPSVASTVEQRMRDILKHTCAAYGVEGELIIHDKYPVLVNPKDTTAIVQNIGKRVVGADSVSSKGLPVSGSEDFSYFLQERPGCYFFVGTIDEAHSQSRNCHSDAVRTLSWFLWW